MRLFNSPLCEPEHLEPQNACYPLKAETTTLNFISANNIYLPNLWSQSLLSNIFYQTQVSVKINFKLTLVWFHQWFEVNRNAVNICRSYIRICLEHCTSLVHSLLKAAATHIPEALTAHIFLVSKFLEHSVLTSPHHSSIDSACPSNPMLILRHPRLVKIQNNISQPSYNFGVLIWLHIIQKACHSPVVN